MIVPSPEIWHRDDFSVLCNWRKLFGLAVEVGVDRAEFALEFLNEWQGRFLVGIDDYRPYPNMPYEREGDYRTALARLEPHAGRSKLIRTSSLEAAALFAPGRLTFGRPGRWAACPPQFIYIDGSHEYEDVRNDLEAWWPIVAEGGIFAGHDFAHEHPDVRRAVTEFADRLGLTVYVTQDRPESWYIYKSGIPGADWVRNSDLPLRWKIPSDKAPR